VRRAVPAADYTPAGMAVVTRRDIDALWGPATPQFAYQIASRIAALVGDLPAGDPVRQYGMERLADLDRLAQGTTKGAEPGH
jgi:hypothetical protein